MRLASTPTLRRLSRPAAAEPNEPQRSLASERTGIIRLRAAHKPTNRSVDPADWSVRRGHGAELCAEPWAGRVPGVRRVRGSGRRWLVRGARARAKAVWERARLREAMPPRFVCRDDWERLPVEWQSVWESGCLTLEDVWNHCTLMDRTHCHALRAQLGAMVRGEGNQVPLCHYLAVRVAARVGSRALRVVLACRRCAACDQPRLRLFRCEACRVETYCGPGCQLRDWPRHRAPCRRLREPWRRDELRMVVVDVGHGTVDLFRF